MKTTIRLLSGILVGVILAGCSADAYVSQENREKFADVNVSKFLNSECLAPQREIYIAVAEHFDFDKYIIREADASNLDALIRDVQGLSGRITIVGHTDFKGSDEYNEKLSMRRAESVEAYLQQQLEPEQYDWEVKLPSDYKPAAKWQSEHLHSKDYSTYVMFEESTRQEEESFCEPPKPERKVYMTMTPHFDFDKSELKPEDLSQLDDFIAKLQDLEGSIMVAGHTDKVGSLSYNQQLAERRAQAVVEYLKTKLNPSQFTWEVKAFGEIQPVINEDSPEANALNRRAFIVFKESELNQ